MITNEEVQFLFHLSQVPHDENTRLVYADWLDDHSRYEDAIIQRKQILGRRAWEYLSRQFLYSTEDNPWILSSYQNDYWKQDKRLLPQDWFTLVQTVGKFNQFLPGFGQRYQLNLEPATELELLEDIALAFSDLPKEQQEYYLTINLQ